MTDIVVIFGAGASHDALRSGRDRPPLTKDLFADRYDDTQQLFPGVDVLSETIRNRVSQGRNLETVLGELANNEAPSIRQQVIEIPVYLKVLLGQFTSNDRPGTYDALMTLIREQSLSAMFVTLNYDTILDEAITRNYRPSPGINSLDSYIAREDWKYVKLHGSVDWGRRLERPDGWAGGPGGPLGGVHEYVRDLQALNVTLDHLASTIEFLPRDAEGRQSRLMFYPALAIPTDLKNEIVCPDQHVEALRDALRSDPAVLVVGNQGLDADLMGILEESTPQGSRKPFRVVDPGDNTEVTWRFAQALNRSGFSMHPDMEFREFVASEEAERFFSDVREAQNTPDPPWS